MIEFQAISKSYAAGTAGNPAVKAIDGLSLSIARGEFVVLIGASGSGKSTLLKMINRMEDHDAGKILLDGREIYSFKVRELRLRMGYAIQSVGLFPHWTVAENGSAAATNKLASCRRCAGDRRPCWHSVFACTNA